MFAKCAGLLDPQEIADLLYMMQYTAGIARPSTGIWHLGQFIEGEIVPELTVALGTATDIPLEAP